MKLTLPAIRVAEPDPARREASEHTVLLLEAIDALLSEAMAPPGAAPSPAPGAACTRSGQHRSRGPRRPVSPA